MDDLANPEPSLPAWIRIPAGILVFGVGLLCAAFSALGLFEYVVDPVSTHPLVVDLVMLAALCTSLWTLPLAVRIVLNRPRRGGGLLSPFVLRVVGLMFFGAALFLLFDSIFGDGGSWWKTPLRVVFDVGVGLTLFKMAHTRSRPPNEGRTETRSSGA